MELDDEGYIYLETDEIITLHNLIIQDNDRSTSGIQNRGKIEYIVQSMKEGYFGEKPIGIHEKAFYLMRGIAANHPFVDGNKRTALLSTKYFYFIHGLEFDYNKEKIKKILKQLATNQKEINKKQTIQYLKQTTKPIEISNKTIGPAIYILIQNILQNNK